MFRRRKQKAWSASTQPSLEEGQPKEKDEGPQGNHIAEKRHISELSSDGAVSELCASSPATQAEAFPKRAELDGR